MIQLIELWETFLMQVDAEEDEQAFYKPPVEPAVPASTAGQGSNPDAVASSLTSDDD